MNNLRIILPKTKFNPLRFSGLKLWLAASEFNTLTLSYNALAETVSGTSGTNSLTASASVAAKLFAGNKIKVGASDIYTIASVATTTITTLEKLTSTYTALTAIAVGQVSQWNDKSGKGNHATQGTGTAQPTFAAGILNGKSVITFDGSDTLIMPSTLYSIPNGSNTIFIVSKRNTESGSVQRLIGMNSGSNTAFRFILGYAATSGSAQYSNSSATAIEKTGNTNTNYQIIMARKSVTIQAISVNNSAEVTDSNGANISDIDRAYIGSNSATDRFLIGGIAEILIYDRALSPAESKQIARYLSNKYAIVIS